MPRLCAAPVRVRSSRINVFGGMFVGRVVVGISGGVDSSVAAYLLKRGGWEVIGAWLNLSDSSGSPENARHARAAARALGIELVELDGRERFEKQVVAPFLSEYLAGRTPNPCVLCNPAVKLRLLAELADARAAEHIATGHYARTFPVPDRVLIAKAPHPKDQSYFLYALGQELLRRVMFPLGDLTKQQVRAIAREAALPAAGSGDSQEICFIPGGDYARFILSRIKEPAVPGRFVGINGGELGRHDGIYRYTVGQRKGLGSFGEPMYVVAIDAGTNTVTLGPAGACAGSALRARDMRWSAFEDPGVPFKAQVKIRSAAPPAEAWVVPGPGTDAQMRFTQPQRAIAPGQAAVVYCGDILLGGGVISERLP